MKLTDQQRRIIEHTLGLDQSDESYRNSFAASEGHSDWETLLELERSGLMYRRPSFTFDAIFAVTTEGRAILNERSEGK